MKDSVLNTKLNISLDDSLLITNKKNNLYKVFSLRNLKTEKDLYAYEIDKEKVYKIEEFYKNIGWEVKYLDSYDTNKLNCILHKDYLEAKALEAKKYEYLNNM